MRAKGRYSVVVVVCAKRKRENGKKENGKEKKKVLWKVKILFLISATHILYLWKHINMTFLFTNVIQMSLLYNICRISYYNVHPRHYNT